MKDLRDLNLTSIENVFISESLTPYKKQLFGEVNKQKKKLKWKYILTQNERIFINANENTATRTFDTVEISKRTSTSQWLDSSAHMLLAVMNMQGRRYRSVGK